MKYVFGPVNSRRLGKSLGLDIIPFKYCSFNCVYCECGATTILTDEVREYIPYENIISEIDNVLCSGPDIDIVTFSGSGEPTLNSRLGDIIKHIKQSYPENKVAVLTNSSLLHRTDVRKGLLGADIIYPSLDAVSENIFTKMMRPISGINPEKIIESITELRQEFSGRLCLEIFIISGLNDTEDELEKLRRASIRIKPDEIHLNHLDRPGTEQWVKPMQLEKMEEVMQYFLPMQVKIVGRSSPVSDGISYLDDIETTLHNTLEEKWQSAGELADNLNLRIADVLKAAERLTGSGKVKKILQGGQIFYALKEPVRAT
jgi:wyosine [tRNA(Phe)-imidazoG37] synthetase (radical SAM superfamily)